MKREAKRQRIAEALEAVGLKGMEKKKVCQCSGGEQQRAAMARLLLKPCVLILADEPTGNLDPQKSDEIMTLLEKINREEKTTILMVTHDITLVNKHRKRTIALEAGHIVADLNEGGYIKHD